MNIGVIFAGGVGSRMNSKKALPKQFLSMHSKPIIIHTLEHFENHEEIDAIVISCVETWLDYMKELVAKYNITKVKKVVPGGETGQMSIYNGLCAAEQVANGEPSVVLIHDGVRPLINAKLLSDSIASVKENGSAITSVPVKETVLMLLEYFPAPIAVIREATKMYEETVFVTSKEEVENITIKGEFVIVVNNAVEQEDDTNNIDINYNKIISELLSDNVSSKDILKMMKALGLKRNDAYTLINKLQS